MMLQELKENITARSVIVTQLIYTQSTGLLTKRRNTLQNISIRVCQRGGGNEAYSALTLMPCKSTSGIELHPTNNLITSLRTQMDEDAMYSFSLLWRLQVQMRSLITSRLETLRQKCSANICRSKSSRQKISVSDTGVHHPKSYLVGK